MRPPICAICDSHFSGEGGIVYFKKRESDHEWDRRMETEGMTGHPPYGEWFCGRHYEEAGALKEMTIDEAMKLMKS